MNSLPTNTEDATSPELRTEARALAMEVISRIAIWSVDAPTLLDRGLRATVALYCLSPDFVGGATLEEIGDRASRSRQQVHKLAKSFRAAIGLTL